MKKNSFKLVELALYYIVIFFILREWLIPIMELTKTGFIGLILLFVAISLLLSLFRIHFIISWVVKIAYITWFITFIYGGVFFFLQKVCILSSMIYKLILQPFYKEIG